MLPADTHGLSSVQMYITIQKVRVSKIFFFFFKEINTFIQQECVNVTFVMLQVISISNKCYFELYSSKNPEKFEFFHKNIKHNCF